MRNLFFGLFFFVFIPGSLFSSYSEKECIENFSELFLEEKFQECLALLDSWEGNDTLNLGTISGLRSSVYFH